LYILKGKNALITIKEIEKQEIKEISR